MSEFDSLRRLQSEISFDCLWIFLAFAFNAGRGPRVFFAEQMYDAYCIHSRWSIGATTSNHLRSPCCHYLKLALSLSWHHRRSSVGFGTSRGAWGWLCLPTICGFCSSQAGEGFQPTVSTVGIVRVSNRFPLNNQDQTAAWNIFVNIHAFQHIHFGRTKLF